MTKVLLYNPKVSTKELVTEIERYAASFHLQIFISDLLNISEL